jgi:putative transposase
LRHEKREGTEYNEAMKRKKNAYKAEFKSKVVMELLTGQLTLNELAAKYQIAPSTLSGWYKQFQEGAAEIFRRGPSEQEKILKEKEQEIAVLQQKVGQLIIERDWLKKKSDEIFGPDGPHQTRFPR